MATTFLNFGPELDQVFADAKAALADLGQAAATETKILAAIEAVASTLNGMIATQTDQTNLLDQILQWGNPSFAPTQIKLELPSIVRKGTGKMANFEINDDWIVTATIKTTNSAGVTEPVPAGDTFTVSSSSASLGVAIGVDSSGNPAVVMTPQVQASPNITVTVNDSAGLMAYSFVVDIVPDVTPTNIVVDLADATHTSQPVPTAPGP